MSDGKYCFEMLDKTKLHNATRRGQKVDESKFVQEWRFELTIPPMMKEKSESERTQYIRELMTVAEADYRKNRNNKRSLGAENILKQLPTGRPRSPSFRPRIKVFCLDKQKRYDWLEGYRNFVGSYREMFDGFRKAAAKRKRPTVEWPEGSYPPGCLYPVGHEMAS